MNDTSNPTQNVATGDNSGELSFKKFMKMADTSASSGGQSDQSSASAKLSQLFSEAKDLLRKIQAFYEEENTYHKSKVDFHQSQILKNTEEYTRYKQELEGLLK